MDAYFERRHDEATDMALAFGEPNKLKERFRRRPHAGQKWWGADA